MYQNGKTAFYFPGRSNPSERGGLDYRILNLKFVLPGFARRQPYRRPNPLLIRWSQSTLQSSQHAHRRARRGPRTGMPRLRAGRRNAPSSLKTAISQRAAATAGGSARCSRHCTQACTALCGISAATAAPQARSAASRACVYMHAYVQVHAHHLHAPGHRARGC